MMRLVRAAIAAALVLLPAPVLAQAHQCTLPQRIDPPRAPEADGPVRRVPISHYTLAVSWSPEYCRGARADGNSMQCSGRHGRFGFVLHGLWPEARSGPSPQWCALTPRPSVELLRRNLCMTPVPWLLEHEWAKHGSCMARRPEDYFRRSAALWNALRWPDADALSRREELTVGDLKREFVAANPDWNASQLWVQTSAGGWLRELRLCYSRRFQPVTCPRGGRGAPDSAPLRIWRGL